eukprot:CAMPEP_0202398768 /NCGR_PEP_ID=MMETSP1128-20130828/1531_1 /ASSEMBLY_ACC=CAM_ASM_000463 /TAXON_ID=3047 /ORGANISM="Dunaliella tertiolecta, Strain CCMP1320" /LENGTH=98 /DNA_ID=CAMNT_0049001953 /DNA_START=204 /DNA_END=500 /DNA_ORIENTATION=-
MRFRGVAATCGPDSILVWTVVHVHEGVLPVDRHCTAPSGKQVAHGRAAVQGCGQVAGLGEVVIHLQHFLHQLGVLDGQQLHADRVHEGILPRALCLRH